mgnify:CR=1 FL=1
MQDRLPFSGFVANFDGKQIQNKEELFRFLEKNVGLPDANNWSSITDWLTDLSWIKAEEYNFILENYDSFLKDDLSSKDLFLEIWKKIFFFGGNAMLKSMLLAVRSRVFKFT